MADSRQILENALKRSAPVVGQISLTLETGRGLTKRNLLTWSEDLRKAAAELEKLCSGIRSSG